jgi:O-antigen ligase
MRSLIVAYKPKEIFALLLFLGFSVIAIIYQQWQWMLIPFAWIILPFIFQVSTQHTQQLFWLLLCMLPLSTELNITPQLGLDFPDEILMLLLTGLALLYWWHKPHHFPLIVWQHPLFFLLILHVCWIAITMVYAIEPIPAMKFLLAKIWYIIPFVILPTVWLNSISGIQKLTACLLWPMSFVIATTLFRHGADEFSFESINRHLFPFFRNHVNYASMLVCLLAVLFCVYHLTPRQTLQRKWLFIALVMGLSALILAYSRGAWLALLAGVVSVFVVRKKQMGALIILAVTAVLLSTAWLITDKRYFRFAPDHDKTIFHTDFSQHLSATVELKDVSNAERYYRWVAGARMLADKPLTGFGPSSFYLHYRPYTVQRFETWVSNNPEHSTVHNYFLLTALEQGVIGLIIFCTLYFFMLMRLQKIYHALHSYFYRAVTITVTVILVMIGTINFISDMIETDKIGSLFWLCMGMVIVLDGKLREEKESLAA